jgi:hypothetical protein
MIYINNLINLLYIISLFFLLNRIYNKKRSNELVYLIAYIFLSLSIVTLTLIFRNKNLIDFVITAYSLIEFFIFSLLMDRYLQNKIKILSIIIKLIYITSVIVYLLTTGTIFDDNLWVAYIPSILLTIQCVYLIKSFLSDEQFDIKSNSDFWIIISIYLLEVFTLPIDVYDFFIFNNTLPNSNIDTYLITSISHSFIYILFNIMIIISIRKYE